MTGFKLVLTGFKLVLTGFKSVLTGFKLAVPYLVHHFNLRCFFHVISNSFFRIARDGRAPFSSGPKIQILDFFTRNLPQNPRILVPYS